MYEWLPLPRVLAWLKVTAGTDQADRAGERRPAAASWCRRPRRDLVDIDTGEFPPDVDADVVQAGVLAAARIYDRIGSPAGLHSYGEFGVGEILRMDPDVAQLLGITAEDRTPMVG